MDDRADPPCSGARHLCPPHRRDTPTGIEPFRVSLPPCLVDQSDATPVARCARESAERESESSSSRPAPRPLLERDRDADGQQKIRTRAGGAEKSKRAIAAPGLVLARADQSVNLVWQRL